MIDSPQTVRSPATTTAGHPGRAGPAPRCGSTPFQRGLRPSTLPAAAATGNLTLKSNAVVERLGYDKESGKISKVHVIDANTKKRTAYSARIFFLNASTVVSPQLLLNSAIEALADAVTLETHPLIKRSKDIANAAVMTSIAAAMAVWAVVLWP